MGSGQDQDIEKRFSNKGAFRTMELDISEYFYIYRWGGIDYYHISTFGMDANDKPLGGEQIIGQIIKTGILNGDIPTGNIVLNPHWNTDYLAQKNMFDKNLKEVALSANRDMKSIC